MWLSTNSIPQTVSDANGYLATNLKWIGWSNPPQSLATKAADHFLFAMGSAILFVALLTLCFWGWEKMRRKRPVTLPANSMIGVKVFGYRSVIGNEGTLDGLSMEDVETDAEQVISNRGNMKDVSLTRIKQNNGSPTKDDSNDGG